MKINRSFCELYGILIGDGCLSIYRSQNRLHHVIRIDGNLSTDKHYYYHIQKLIKKVINKEAKIKHRENQNRIFFMFHDKSFLYFMNKEYNFPIGIKCEIGISKKIIKNWTWTKEVLRGIFDTDGCIYFTKNDYHKRRNYPIIEIVTYSNKLIKQIKSVLTKKGFIVKIGHNGNSIKLNGKYNVNKWIKEIGSNNLDKLSKFLFWKKFGYGTKIEELPLKERLEKIRNGPEEI